MCTASPGRGGQQGADLDGLLGLRLWLEDGGRARGRGLLGLPLAALVVFADAVADGLLLAGFGPVPAGSRCQPARQASLDQQIF